MDSINNAQEDDADDIDVVIPMYNLIKYSDNYSKTSGILRQYCRDKSALAANASTDFTVPNAFTYSFKEKITGETEKMTQKMLK